jgi:hypothetical protein
MVLASKALAFGYFFNCSQRCPERRHETFVPPVYSESLGGVFTLTMAHARDITAIPETVSEVCILDCVPETSCTRSHQGAALETVK